MQRLERGVCPVGSFSEAKLVSQSLISHSWEDIPHKMKLKNKVIEAPLCTSLQLLAHPFLMQFCWQRDSSEDSALAGNRPTRSHTKEMVPKPP